MGKRTINDDEIVHYILDEIAKPFGLPPTVRQIAERFDISRGGAAYALDRIEAGGKIQRLRGRHRGMVVTKQGKAAARAAVAKQQQVETT